MPPAVAWSQMEIQDWKHVKPHLGTSAVWKIISADEKMRYRKTYAICELCFAAASLDPILIGIQSLRQNIAHK